MINQNQLQSSEKMVDLFETEELESRLEMCGSWADADACNDGYEGGSSSPGSGSTTSGSSCQYIYCATPSPDPAQE